jgi:antirestriction protein ArdC
MLRPHRNSSPNRSDNWLRVRKADKKAIFTAASKASQAAAFLAGLQPVASPSP